MMRIACSLSLLILLVSSAWSADVLDISNETELDAAIAQAVSGDTLALDASFTITNPIGSAGSPVGLPTGVTLDGGGFTISSSGTLVDQRQADVVYQNLGLTTSGYDSWRISARAANVQFINCTITGRMITWAGGEMIFTDCDIETVIPVPPDSNLRFTEPFGVFGGDTSPSTMSLSNCFVKAGWTGTGPDNSGRNSDNGLFHNFGGNPGSLLVDQCTIVGATDWTYSRSAPNADNYSFFKSDNASGGASAFDTQVSNSVMIGDASAIFRSEGNGTVSSSYNCNAGTIQNPTALRATEPGAPAFYSYSGIDVTVDDQTGDITERTPFVDHLNDDFRLLASSDAATGNSTGGPMGADLGVVDNDANLANAEFDLSTSGVDWILVGHDEELFYSWNIFRGVDDLFFYGTSDGVSGRGMRLEAQDTFDETGGDAHNTYVLMSAYQTFVAKPGYRYTVEVFSRRNASTGFTWADNGSFGNTIVGIADGVEPNPNAVAVSSSMNGAENTYEQGQVTWEALSNHLTVHLIHRTNGSWNLSDWDTVTISAVPGDQPTGIQSFELYE
jgi:hypothetical protein